MSRRRRGLVSVFWVLLVLVAVFGVVLNVPLVWGNGPIYIRADGSIDPPDALISTFDNVTYTLTDNILSSGDGIIVERNNIIIDGAGYTVEGTGSGKGFYLSGMTNVTIKNTNITYFDYGIWLGSSSSNTINGNTITNDDYGIYVFSSSDSNILTGNNIANTQSGIYLNSSSNNSMSGNTITNNHDRGIRLHNYSNHNSIGGNSITNNWCGIWLYSSSDYNNIYKNSIVNNDYGIGFDTSSNYNSVYENNVTASTSTGIRVNFVSNNKFYHNNFIGNTYPAVAMIPGCDNSWDNGYPSGGNYWSDYTGVDANGDGIGDTPYVIDENNRDRYPLMTSLAPQSPEHELVASITAPAFLQLGSSSLLNATVTNNGLNDEVNVESLLIINGTTVNSTIIPLLQAGNSYTLSYDWTPTVEGTHNVTAYAHPVSGETFVGNNQMTKFVTVAVSAPTPEVQVGVKAGDWIKCTYTISGWPAETAYPEWLKVEFLSVEGTNAIVRVTMRMSDGTEQNATVPVDVVAGGQAFGLSGFVIPANLTTGDIIFMSGYGNVTIAGETTRTYAGTGRTVVYASFSQYGTQLTYYWDKQTGVMVEASVTSGTMTGTGKATETNMWQAAPGFPIDPIILSVLIVIVIVIVIAVFLVRRKKKPTEAQRSET